MEEKIINIVKEICEIDNIEANMDTDLIEEELLDSLGFINLISCLEDEFDIEIQPTEVPAETWRSVNNIIKYIKSIIE